MSKEIVKINERLRYLGVNSENGGSSEEEIKLFEKEIGNTLPDVYRGFIKIYGCLNSGDNILESITSNTEVGNLYAPDMYDVIGDGDYSLISSYHVYKDRIPEELIPIANLPFGDQLCIGIKKEFRGKIYYWNHDKELMDIESIEDMWIPVLGVFDSFYDFIMSMESRDDSYYENKDKDKSKETGCVIRVNADTLMSIKEFIKNDKD